MTQVFDSLGMTPPERVVPAPRGEEMALYRLRNCPYFPTVLPPAERQLPAGPVRAGDLLRVEQVARALVILGQLWPSAKNRAGPRRPNSALSSGSSSREAQLRKSQ